MLLAWGWDSCAEELALLLKLLKETCPATGEWTLLLFCLWHIEKERLITVIFSLELKVTLFFPKISPATWEWTLLFFCLWKGERENERLITVIFSLELKVILFLLKLDPGAL